MTDHVEGICADKTKRAAFLAPVLRYMYSICVPKKTVGKPNLLNLATNKNHKEEGI